MKFPNVVAMEVLVTCFYKCGETSIPENPAVEEALYWLRNNKAIEWCPEQDHYITTELGRAWVRALLRVPMPKQVYVDRDGEVLV
jgi:hypothetical protein